VPPLLRIEKIVVDGKVEPTPRMLLPAARSLAIDYTA